MTEPFGEPPIDAVDVPTATSPVDCRAVVAVIMLTQGDCGLCEHAKEVLQRVDQDPRLPVRLALAEVELGSEQGRRLAGEAGVLFAPGILLNGQPFSHGRLSERKLRRTLARLAPQGP